MFNGVKLVCNSHSTIETMVEDWKKVFKNIQQKKDLEKASRLHKKDVSPTFVIDLNSKKEG